MKDIILNNGVKIPNIGFGTWQIKNGKECYESTLTALKVGYRHVDTAIAYENEESVGKAIKDSGIAREKIFITTKIPAEIKTYEGAKAAIESSLKSLGVDYIDLMIIHAPRPWSEMNPSCKKTYEKENIEVYKALEEAYEAKKLRAIGISNFGPYDIENIIRHCYIKPVLNQIAHFVTYTQNEICECCKKYDILVEAYSPFGTGKILNDPRLIKMAEKYHATVADICLAFCYQRNTLPLPKSVHPERIKANFESNIKLTEEDFEYLNNL